VLLSIQEAYKKDIKTRKTREERKITRKTQKYEETQTPQVSGAEPAFQLWRGKIEKKIKNKN
jgi:hypothetical protein